MNDRAKCCQAEWFVELVECGQHGTVSPIDHLDSYGSVVGETSRDRPVGGVKIAAEFLKFGARVKIMSEALSYPGTSSFPRWPGQELRLRISPPFTVPDVNVSTAESFSKAFER